MKYIPADSTRITVTHFPNNDPIERETEAEITVIFDLNLIVL
jgi:hypothetical protein